MHELLASLGYWLDRVDGGHLVYLHRSQAPFTVPSTPSDWRARKNALAHLKRRHPKAPVFRKKKAANRKSSSARAAARRARLNRQPLALVAKYEPVVSVKKQGGELRMRFHRCQECLRPWWAEGLFPDAECRGCGSRKVTVEIGGRAA